MEDIFEIGFRGLWKLLRFLLQEIFFEFAVQGPGYLIVKYGWPPNWKKSVDPDSLLVVLCGIGFWLVVAALGFEIWD